MKTIHKIVLVGVIFMISFAISGSAVIDAVNDLVFAKNIGSTLYVNSSYGYTTIQDAVNAATSGKIVVTNSLSTTAVNPKSDIAIECLPGVTLTLSAGNYLISETDNTVILNGFSIKNCNIVNGGIKLNPKYFTGITEISGNNISGAPEHAIFITEQDTFPRAKKIIEKNMIGSYGISGVAYGIYVDYAPNTDILYNNITGYSNYDAIEMGNLGEITAQGNTIRNGSQLQFPFADNSIIDSNTVYGATIQNDGNTANNVTITNNKVLNAVSDESFGGISITGADAIISGNTVVMSSGASGIRVYGGNNSIISENRVLGNGTTSVSTVQCIYAQDNYFNNIFGNRLSNCYRGINHVMDENIIHDNMFSNIDTGVYFALFADSAHTMKNNSVYDNHFSGSVTTAISKQVVDDPSNEYRNNFGDSNCEGSTSSVGIELDNSTNALSTGIQGDIRLPWSGRITEATVMSRGTGDLAMQFWIDSWANFPPTVADLGGRTITMTGASSTTDTTLAGWTTAVASGDVIRFNISAVPTVNNATVLLKVCKN